MTPGFGDSLGRRRRTACARPATEGSELLRVRLLLLLVPATTCMGFVDFARGCGVFGRLVGRAVRSVSASDCVGVLVASVFEALAAEESAMTLLSSLKITRGSFFFLTLAGGPGGSV
jgi:hypothetical protein